MRRRDFLRVTSGATAATAAGVSGVATAQESPTGTTTPGSPTGTGTPMGTETATGGGGGEVEVSLVDYAFEPGTSEPLVIPPGTTVRFVWETDGHNIVVREQPADASWSGHEPIENTGFEHEHTFTVTGEYHIVCVPHEGLGMVGDITVEEGAPLPGEGGAEAGGGEAEVDPEEMGVAFQAHYVGAATILGIVISLIFTFFLLKYGETPHSGYPGREN